MVTQHPKYESKPLKPKPQALNRMAQRDPNCLLGKAGSKRFSSVLILKVLQDLSPHYPSLGGTKDPFDINVRSFCPPKICRIPSIDPASCHNIGIMY